MNALDGIAEVKNGESVVEEVQDLMGEEIDACLKNSSCHRTNTISDSSPPPVRLLCVDDSVSDTRIIKSFYPQLLQNLLVQPFSINVYKVMMQSLGYNHNVTYAGGSRAGERALALIMIERFDMVMVDRKMPGVDGWKVADAVRRSDHYRGKTIPTPVFMVGIKSNSLSLCVCNWVIRHFGNSRFVR